MTHRKIIVSLLHNLGTRREVSKYLDAFAPVQNAPPVLIKVGGAILEDHMEALGSALACLGHIGMHPVVVHGAGPQISAAMERQGLHPVWRNGLRVTTPEVIDTALAELDRLGAALEDELERFGVGSQRFLTGAVSAESAGDPALGLVGRVTSIDRAAVDRARREGRVPILSPLGLTPRGEVLNINADTVTRELALRLPAQKVVFLTGSGGLRDERGRVISAINLEDDFEHLMSAPWVHGGMRVKLREILGLLDPLPFGASVSITSPEHLASELFTHKGNGTLIRKGLTITEHRTLEGIDTGRLRALVSSSFGRPLLDDYFTEQRFDRVFVAGDYAAAALLTEGGPAPYLDKFAVTHEAQGLGLAASLWRRVVAHAPRLFWRSRLENDINGWYFTRADGMRRYDDWVVFWRGIDNPAEIDELIAYALSKPASFASATPPEPAHV